MRFFGIENVYLRLNLGHYIIDLKKMLINVFQTLVKERNIVKIF
jgi:hypothetical protein